MKYCPYCMNELTDNNSICPHCGRNSEEYQNPVHALKQGAMLNNRYLIGGMIGEGGFGITYIGLDTLLQYRVAVKEFFPNGMVNRNNTVANDVLSISTETAKEVFSKSRENFLREARTLAKFNNEPGIVAVKDFFEENHTVYIVMEYLEGITLKKYLADFGRMSPNDTVCLLMPVFRSLQKIHSKKLIHRDISPDNIMLVGEDVKLLDFGAAREFADEKSLSVMLKHGYAPMEQYRRHGIQGEWTDVYAICATMYKCITGSIPPDAPDRVFEDELKMPSELGIPVEPAFEEVLRQGLAIKPDDRIQSIDELLEKLDAVPGIDIGSKKETTTIVSEMPTEKNPSPTPSDPAKTEAPPKDHDVRLSEYVPHMFDDEDEQPKPADPSKPEPIPKESEKPEEEPKKEPKKPDKKNFVLIGSIAAAVLIIGVAAAIVLSMGNHSVETDDPKTSSQTETTVPESSTPESSVVSIPESKTESSVVSMPESKTESSVVSKPESKAESSVVSKPESKAESSVVSKPESKTEPSADTSEESEMQVIDFPNLKNYFQFEDGMLLMDYGLFGKDINAIAKLFPGTLFTSKNHPIYGDQYTILYIPLDTPNYTDDSFDTIDLYFLDRKLVSVEFESIDGFDEGVAAVAQRKLGTPTHAEKEDYLWMISNRDVSFALYMKEYPEEGPYGSIMFTQKYFTSDAAVG